MEGKILIYIGLVLIVFYFVSSVPYCKMAEEEILVDDALYTFEETLELKNITAMLLHTSGKSMFPTIQDNSKCLCVKKEKYVIGDIILFFADINGQFNGIIHRIVIINSEGIFTKGDNNEWIDPPMTDKSIICSIPSVPRWRTLF